MGVSLVFWFFVKLSKTYETTQDILLQYQLPPGRQFMEIPPATMAVSLSDSGWKLLYNFLFHPHPTVSFELSSELKQEIQRDELISKVEQASNVKVANMGRNYLQISLDVTASKRVPVLLDADIEYRHDFYLRDSILIIPDSITIFGSRQLLEQLSNIKTEKLVLTGPEYDIRRVLQIEKPENLQCQLSATEVEVFIPVEQFTEKFFNLPVRVAHTRDSMRILPALATVTCLVGLSRFEELNDRDLVVEADFTGIENPTRQNTVPLKLTSCPDWVRSVSILPKSVEYLIIQ